MQRGLWLAPGVDPELGRAWQRDFGGWFNDERLALPGQACGRLARIDSPMGPLLAKRNARRGWLVWSGLRAAHGLRAFRVGRRMHAAGIPTAEALGYVQVHGKAPSLDGALLCRFEEGQSPFELLEQQEQPLTHLDQCLESLARGIAGLHAKGFRQRDMKAANLLLRRQALDTHLQVQFIDLEGSQGPLEITPQIVSRDLARLCASFLSPRAQAIGIKDAHWHQWVTLYFQYSGRHLNEIPGVLKNTRKWALEHNARNTARGRPLS